MTVTESMNSIPKGINNVHALNYIHEPIHTSFKDMDHPSYAIILQIHTLIVPKIHEKDTISTASAHISCITKFTVKLRTWLECTI